ncbi:DNA-binding transcriptional regulator KdgR [Halomonas eurihalina]|uniref:DNA-binding transcriptional regulator KdgR n=1 Tax=Halomonas eurihalina TaxID=42566 RepID=A0A5D9CR37_HALER|nr:DNA-binding transcriptional regulator KdgR [Halomonas eurihalina]MDR5860387.1 DNA-binding transcriptional regulator KdgR [Halomonas eurihalina]TZG33937.1 DNA-binding transcriptional regulator KdgR [Halomonas eurihalina]
MATSQKPDNVAAVMKVFGILEGLAEQREIGLSELSQRAVTSKSTAYRFLQTMKELGYVSQEEESEKYALTLKLFELGSSALQHVDLTRLADVEMRKLSEQTHEAIHLGVLDDDPRQIMYIHKYSSQYNLCMQSRIGRRNPVYSTAMGKVLLAWMDQERAREVLESVDFVAHTEHTLTSVEAVMGELPEIRKEGVAEDREEAELGVRCLSVPVFDRFGHAVAALSLSFPVVRYDAKKRAEYIRLLHEAGRRISAGQGFHEYSFEAHSQTN